MTQGDLLAMVMYGLVILPLFRELRKAHRGITQPCNADNTESGGTLEGIRIHLDELMVRRPWRGYFLDPTKSILGMSPRNVPRAEEFFQGYGLQIVTGRRYLGGFVSNKEAQDI